MGTICLNPAIAAVRVKLCLFDCRYDFFQFCMLILVDWISLFLNRENSNNQ